MISDFDKGVICERHHLCTASVLGVGGLRPCMKESKYIATDPEGGKYYRCEQHGQEAAMRFKFTLEERVS